MSDQALKLALRHAVPVAALAGGAVEVGWSATRWASAQAMADPVLPLRGLGGI